MSSIVLSCFLVAFSLALGLIAAGPVQVRVETDDQQSFHVGPQARTTFELVEEYRPLSTAFNQLNRPRALSSSLSKVPAEGLKPQQAQILVDFGDKQVDNLQQGREVHSQPATHFSNANANDVQANKPKHSQWMEWTRWSGCSNGERIRVRQCLEVNNEKCQGESVERQKCFSFQQSSIPFAKDPLVIEKEIVGGEPDQPVRI